MSQTSPEPVSAQTTAGDSHVQLPAYSAKAPASPGAQEDKIAYQPDSSDSQKIPADQNQKSEIQYEDYPEVVGPEDAEKPKYLATEANETSPPIDSNTMMPTPSSIGATVQLDHGIAPTPPPVSDSPSLPPQLQEPQGYNNRPQTMTVPDTVTPLNLLGDQPDAIDCPFCQRRTETYVKKHPSGATHAGAVALFFTTVIGVAAPYLFHCCSNTGHYCQNCDRKVAFKKRGSKGIEVFGTPDHLRQPSKYPHAEPKQAPLP